jgi:hypothetical protein
MAGFARESSRIRADMNDDSRPAKERRFLTFVNQAALRNRIVFAPIREDSRERNFRFRSSDLVL